MARRIKARLIMKLLAAGLSQNAIARSQHVSKHSVEDVARAARDVGLDWEAASAMSDAEVYEALFPGRGVSGPAYDVPDWGEVHRELAKSGVTLRLLHEEYSAACSAGGRVAMGYDRFCKLYGAWVTESRVTSRVARKAAQVTEVDWAGGTVPLVDPVTGECGEAYLFVACLPFSRYAYAEACGDEREGSWLRCHVHAFEYFGGSTPIIVPDNLKTGVTSHGREEVVLNDAYREMAAHYCAAVLPARVRHPKDKPGAENTVYNAATAIVARLRGRTFASVGELNAAMRPLLDAFNAEPFQKREGSRASVFEEVERPLLRPLPSVPYEACEWVRGRKVQLNCHVAYKRNYYSAPYALVGRTVDLRVTESALEVWCGGERVATHALFPAYARNRYSTRGEDVPPGAGWTQWDRPRVERWASRVGPSCAECVQRIFRGCSFDEQGLNPSLSLLRLSRTYSEGRLEAACGLALASGCRSPRYAQVSAILRSGQDKRGGEPTARESGGYVRGGAYYGGGDAR